MAPDFQFPGEQTAFWVPFNLERGEGQAAIAKLNTGLSIEAATAEVTAIFGPQRPASTFEVVGLQDEHGSSLRPALLILLAAVGFVLLIACANLANLQLSRATARHRELVLRNALGAGRARLIRQLITESLVVAVAGGLVGTCFAFVGIELLRGLLTGLATRPDLTQMGVSLGTGALPLVPPRLDLTTLLFTAAICTGAGLVSGTAPALLARLGDATRTLHQGGAAAIPGFGLRRRSAAGSILVVTQVTFAIVLLVGGGLLMHSFVKLLRIDTGFEPAGVVTFNLRLSPDRLTVTENARVARELVDRLQRLPGVRAAGYTFALPTVSLQIGSAFRLSRDEALPRLTPGSRPNSQNPRVLMAGGGYTKALGMRIVKGRDLDEATRGILINETLARDRFPEGSPVGRQVYLGGDPVPWPIEGVVDDVWTGLEEAPGPQVIRTFPPASSRELNMFGTRYYYAVRTNGPPLAALPAIRSIVRQIDDQAFLDNVTSLEQLLASSIARPRMYALLLGMFGAVAALLAGIGIYGVMAYAVTQATRELGLRMALGAKRGDVVALVLRRAIGLTAVGVVLGLAGAAGLSRYLQGMLFGLTPLDLPTYAAVTIAFSTVATVAAYLPASRATKVDPLAALRCE
jgi:putative ABC transport system permease protein